MNIKLCLFSLLFLMFFHHQLCSMDISANNADYEPNTVVIKFKPEYKMLLDNHSQTGFGLADLDRTLSKIGVTGIDSRFQTNPKKYKPGLPDLSLIYTIVYSKPLNPYNAADILMQYKYLDYAEPLYIDNILDTPNDTKYPEMLFLNAMQASAAWDIHKGINGTEEVILAIIDTGVNWKHPDIKDNIKINDAELTGITINWTAGTISGGNGIDDDGNGKIDDVIGWDFMLNSSGAEANNPYDAAGHGSSVAGLADARTNNSAGVCSIAWNVKLMPISCSYSGSSSLYKGYDAIIYAAENGADVINYSAGGSSASQANEDAISYAYGLGSIIFAAAGNTNNAAILYPAAYPGVVAVASVTNAGVKTSVSNYGKVVDVCVPTDSLYSITTGTGYNTISLGGATSYASPIAAGLAALLKSAHPTWTNEQVINQLISTCTNLDASNPTYINYLGDGMLNAYAALTEVSPVPEQELRISFKEVMAPSDANANRALERGELFSFNLKVRNYAHGVSSNNVTYTLTCSDPYITILNNTYIGSLPRDGYGLLTDAFQCRVSDTANTKAITCTLTVVADLPITSGASMTFSFLINAGGIFVWEGKAGRDYSGTYIKTWLTNHGYSAYYSTIFPPSFHTFSSVFLSFGAVGSSETRFNSLTMFRAVNDYLMEGGRLYMEGTDAVGFDMGEYLPDVGGGLSAADILWDLLGIEDAEDGLTNNIDNLSGQPISLADGITFVTTNQVNKVYIDRFTPTPLAAIAFTESNYGTVAIQNYGSYGQKSLIFSYILAELVDGSGANTKDSLMHRIMADFTTTGSTIFMENPDINIERIDNSIKLSWDSVPHAASYRIESSNSPYGGFNPEETISGTDWTTTQTFGQKYYRVIAGTNGL